jgi:hypothetical protein
VSTIAQNSENILYKHGPGNAPVMNFTIESVLATAGLELW